MKFCTVLKLPVGPVDQTTPPTTLIREAIEREGGAIETIYGRNGGWDCICVYAIQSPEAQVQAMVALRRAGFQTETFNLTESAVLDAAWENAFKRPVAAGTRSRS